ncbi:MAG: Ig-like domain-containing protein [Candidatus Poribacteria bacterium]|nr:Ig-like domain-containing protein [Candidatus Poribacteria bacterium]
MRTQYPIRRQDEQPEDGTDALRSIENSMIRRKRWAVAAVLVVASLIGVRAYGATVTMSFTGQGNGATPTQTDFSFDFTRWTVNNEAAVSDGGVSDISIGTGTFNLQSLKVTPDATTTSTWNIDPGAQGGSLHSVTLTAGDPQQTIDLSGNANFQGISNVLFYRTDVGAGVTVRWDDIVVIYGNTAPTATAQTVTPNEDVDQAITLAGTDPESDTLTYKIATLPANGALYQTANGTTRGGQISSAGTTVTDTLHRVIYVSASNGNGAGHGNFTFSVSDADFTSTATVTVNVTAVNDAPTFDAISNVTTNEDTTPSNITITGGSPGGGADESGQTVTYSATSSNTAILANPTVTTTTISFSAPVANANGTVTITVTADDAQGANNTFQRTFTITFSPVNDTPTATAQTVNGTEDTHSTITLTGSDVDADALTYVVVTLPAAGSLYQTADGTTLGTQITTVNTTVTDASRRVIFVPVANANGNGYGNFTFKVNDGTVDSSAAAVTVNVAAVNDAPVATAQSVTLNEDVATAITLAGTDIEGDALTFTIVTGPTKGALSGTSPNLIYTPTANLNGADSFTFKANDGTVDSASNATVTLTITPVNDAPVANAQNVVTNEDVATAVTLTATDVEGDTLTYTVLTQPTNGALSGTAPNLTYTPATNYFGADSFTFKVNDGALDSATATISITDTAVNDAPIANAQSVATNEDTALSITLTGSDVEGDTLTYSIVAAPARGALSGTAPNLTYTPTANLNGADSFTFKANDGTTDSATATVSINVFAINDAPTITAISNVTVNEDTTPSDIALAGVGPGGAADESGQTVTITATSSNTSIIANPTISGTTLSFSAPVANANGAVTITVTLNDGQASNNTTTTTFTLTLTPVNDLPVANAQTVSTNEDTALSITLTGSDIEGSVLTYTVVTQPTLGALSGTAPNLTYTPTANLNGADSFTFKVNDGMADSAANATVSITVVAVNDPPTLNAIGTVTVNEDATPSNITLTGIGPGGGADETGQTVTLTAISSDPSIMSNPTIVGTTLIFSAPVTDANGTVAITVAANDGQSANNTTIRTFILNVTAVNDAPTFTAPANVTTDEDVQPSPVTIAGIHPGGGTDEASQTVALTATSSNTGIVGNPTVSGSTLTFPVPVANAHGVVTITVVGNDGQGANATVTRAFTLTVAPVNDRPVAVGSDEVTDEDTPLMIPLTASDLDNDPLTFIITTFPMLGTATVSGSTVTYTPDPNVNGMDSFDYVANDGTIDSAVVTVMITVNPVEDSPIAESQTLTTNEDNALPITLVGTDADGDSLVYALLSTTTNGVLTGTMPNLTYTPNVNVFGSDTFSFVVNDGKQDSATATISITVVSVNDLPIADTQSFALFEDNSKELTLTGSDVETASLTFNILTTPEHGTLTGVAPNLTYHPLTDYAGLDQFTFNVNDGTANSATATIHFTVIPVDDIPLAHRRFVTIPEDTSIEIILEGVDNDTTDPDFDYSIVIAPSFGSLSGERSIRHYTPNPSFSGEDMFRFQINDDVAFSQADVTITVTPINDPPSFDTVPNTLIRSTGGANVINITGVVAGGEDEAWQVVSLTATSSNPSLIARPQIEGDGSERMLTLRPARNTTGTATITITATDNGLRGGEHLHTSQQSFLVTVAEPGDVVVKSVTTYPPDPRTVEGPIETRLIAANVSSATFAIDGVAKAQAVLMRVVGGVDSEGFQTYVGAYVVERGDENVSNAPVTVRIIGGADNLGETIPSQGLVNIDTVDPKVESAITTPSPVKNGALFTLTVKTEPKSTVVVDVSAVDPTLPKAATLTESTETPGVYTRQFAVSATNTADDGDRQISISVTDAAKNTTKASGAVILSNGAPPSIALHVGLNLIHVPISLSNLRTARQLYDYLGGPADVGFVLLRRADGQAVAFTEATHQTNASSLPFAGDDGVVVAMKNAKTVSFLGGTPLSPAVTLDRGVNFVGIPRYNPAIASVSAVAALSPNISTVVREQNGDLISFPPSDAPLRVGQGLIVIASEPTTLTIDGVAWTSAPSVAATPINAEFVSYDRVPAFVVEGVVLDERNRPLNGLTVEIVNHRTGKTYAARSGSDSEFGAFAAAMLDVESGFSAGDTVDLRVIDPSGTYRQSDESRRTLTRDDIRNARWGLDKIVMREIPSRSAMLPNFPNPFNPETWIPFQLSDEADVTLTIYDLGGSVVRVLSLGAMEPGIYATRSRAAHWDGRNALGETVAGGVYIVEFKAGDYREQRRVVIAK